MSWCEPYQPLPISTGASGLDRCGNVVAYAAPGVVQAPVGWCNWPIPAQLPWWPWCGGSFPGPVGSGPPWGWWGGGGQGSWGPGPIDPGFTAPPWWGAWQQARGGQTIQQAAAARGASIANWMLGMRAQPPAAPRRAA